MIIPKDGSATGWLFVVWFSCFGGWTGGVVAALELVELGWWVEWFAFEGLAAAANCDCSCS